MADLRVQRYVCMELARTLLDNYIYDRCHGLPRDIDVHVINVYFTRAKVYAPDMPSDEVKSIFYYQVLTRRDNLLILPLISMVQDL